MMPHASPTRRNSHPQASCLEEAASSQHLQFAGGAAHLPLHDLLRAGQFERAERLVRSTPGVDLLAVDGHANSALHLACMATRGVAPAPVETVQVTFPDGCAAGTKVLIQSSSRQAMEVTIPDGIAPGGQFLTSVAVSPSSTQHAPAMPTAAVAAAALRVIDALLSKCGPGTRDELLSLRNNDGFWAGQLCRPGQAQGMLLGALHEALIHAASAQDVNALQRLSELVDDRTVPRQVGAELLRQSASSYALPSASKQTDSASNDDGENEMLSLNWVLSFIKTKVESGFEVNDGPGGHSALHLAAQGGNVRLVERLVAEGGDIYRRDVGGNAPIDLAQSRQLLLKMQAAHDKQRLAEKNARVAEDHASEAEVGNHDKEDDSRRHHTASALNLREPCLRLVDYVAIMAFDADTKQSTVEWRYPTDDHEDFVFDPNASVFAAAPPAQLAIERQDTAPASTSTANTNYIVHTSIINRQADMPAIFVTSLTFWRDDLLAPMAEVGSGAQHAKGDSDKRDVSSLAIFSQWGFLEAFEQILHFMMRNIGTPAFRIDRFVAELCEVMLPEAYATGSEPAPAMHVSLMGDCLYNALGELQLSSQLCQFRVLPPAFPSTVAVAEARSLARLSQRLSPDTITKCLGYLLNNFSLMLLSDDVRELSTCAEALRALAHPFELPHVYIPYLPRMLGDTCRAPVSFLMGMLLEDYMSIELDEAVTFATVYLEHDRFIPPVSVEVEANVTADRMGISPRGETEPLEALTDPVELSTPKRRPSWKMRWKRKSKSVTSSKDGSTAPEVAASEARMKAEHRASLGRSIELPQRVGQELYFHLQEIRRLTSSSLLDGVEQSADQVGATSEHLECDEWQLHHRILAHRSACAAALFSPVACLSMRHWATVADCADGSLVRKHVLPFIASSHGHAADVPFARLFLIGQCAKMFAEEYLNRVPLSKRRQQELNEVANNVCRFVQLAPDSSGRSSQDAVDALCEAMDPSSEAHQLVQHRYKDYEVILPTWLALVDPDSHHTYWENQVTYETQWEHPYCSTLPPNQQANGNEGGADHEWFFPTLAHGDVSSSLRRIPTFPLLTKRQRHDLVTAQVGADASETECTDRFDGGNESVWTEYSAVPDEEYEDGEFEEQALVGTASASSPGGHISIDPGLVVHGVGVWDQDGTSLAAAPDESHAPALPKRVSSDHEGVDDTMSVGEAEEDARQSPSPKNEAASSPRSAGARLDDGSLDDLDGEAMDLLDEDGGVSDVDEASDDGYFLNDVESPSGSPSGSSRDLVGLAAGSQVGSGQSGSMSYRLEESDVQNMISHFVNMTPRAALAAEQVALAQTGDLELYSVSEAEDEDDMNVDENESPSSTVDGVPTDEAAQGQKDGHPVETDCADTGYSGFANRCDRECNLDEALGRHDTASYTSDTADWAELYDENYGCAYYYNRVTQQCRWERPDEMDAPHAVATGNMHTDGGAVADALSGNASASPCGNDHD